MHVEKGRLAPSSEDQCHRTAPVRIRDWYGVQYSVLGIRLDPASNSDDGHEDADGGVQTRGHGSDNSKRSGGGARLRERQENRSSQASQTRCKHAATLSDLSVQPFCD